MAKNKRPQPLPLSELLPHGGRLLFTGGGKEFIERVGVEAARQAVVGVLKGENVRAQTEPLTRRRIAQIDGALIAMFVKGWLEIDQFTNQLSEMATRQYQSANKSDKAAVWPALWTLGLTNKGVQNVLRSSNDMSAYIASFEAIVEDVSGTYRKELGGLEITLGFIEDKYNRRAHLGWKDIIRLTTAIGSQATTIRGSEKSIYGKLFEKLVLGSFLTILGYKRVDPQNNITPSGVFWLSDSRSDRESDATLLIQPGKLARFDIGFIGEGNPEISKDKLSRYAREEEYEGVVSSYKTFIIVDKLPNKSKKTEEAAKRIGAEIVQMSMQYWPKQLARLLYERLGVDSELKDMDDSKIGPYLEAKLANIAIQDFLVGVSLSDLEQGVDQIPPEAPLATDDDDE